MQAISHTWLAAAPVTTTQPVSISPAPALAPVEIIPVVEFTSTFWSTVAFVVETT